MCGKSFLLNKKPPPSGRPEAEEVSFLAAKETGSAYSGVMTRHLNMPHVITRATDNQIVWRWDHGDPFGLLGPDENPGGLGVFTYNLRFPGQYYDRETGLFYNGLRDGYDPATGTYIQPDPIGNALYEGMAARNLFATRGVTYAGLSGLSHQNS